MLPISVKTAMILLRLTGIVLFVPPAFELDDFEPDLRHGLQAEEIARKTIAIAPGLLLQARIEISAKYNGGLYVRNIQDIKVLDGHNNGDMFRGYLLTVKFADFDGDGYRDLVIYGWCDYYEDRSDRLEILLLTLPILHLYRFNPKTHGFDTVFVYAPTRYDVFDRGKY